jgi:hypothetical protein
METECPLCEVRTGLQVLLQVASISQLTVSRLSRQYGIYKILQPYRPPRPVTRRALLLFNDNFILQYAEHVWPRSIDFKTCQSVSHSCDCASATRVGRSYVILIYIINNIFYSTEEEACFPLGKTTGE